MKFCCSGFCCRRSNVVALKPKAFLPNKKTFANNKIINIGKKKYWPERERKNRVRHIIPTDPEWMGGCLKDLASMGTFIKVTMASYSYFSLPAPSPLPLSIPLSQSPFLTFPSPLSHSFSFSFYTLLSIIGVTWWSILCHCPLFPSGEIEIKGAKRQTLKHTTYWHR